MDTKAFRAWFFVVWFFFRKKRQEQKWEWEQCMLVWTLQPITGLYKGVIAMWHFGRQHNNVISNEIIWMKKNGALLEEKDVASGK